LKNTSRFRLILLLLVLALITVTPALAQEEDANGPVYIVEAGDTLASIAFRFGVSVKELADLNAITNVNLLAVGDRLVIPGLEGVRGVLTTESILFGDSMRSLSRRHQIPAEGLARLNRLVSPAQLYAGRELVLPVSEENGGLAQRAFVRPGQSVLQAAVAFGANPWTLALLNGYPAPSLAAAGDVLLLPGEGSGGPGALPEAITGVVVETLPLVQGRTFAIQVESAQELDLGGSLAVTDLRDQDPISRELLFFPHQDGYIALQGVHAMASPGLHPIQLQVALTDGSRFTFTQLVPLRAGGYIFDLPLQVDPQTLDPEVTAPEDELWLSLATPATPDRLWEGVFQAPSPFADLWTSRYGSRRSYNGSPYNYFHTGLDFVGGVGVEIWAPAPGVVRFAGPLVVRGNATVIDHGWGVFTAYMHQSEILVAEGDRVEAGQLIGLVGGTGRVTGAHLHWEVWVGGIQVDPVEWLERPFP
jgi:murein DD-endopeptidase MepM/ murein hydrolase activator NlpD